MLQRCQDIESINKAIMAYRQEKASVAFVPTMGALHEGHLSLVRLAKKKADRVVVSIFVNPLQFGAGEDFEVYPRTLEEDALLLEKEGVDALFLPEALELYPDGFQTLVVNDSLSKILCGKSRPGHFQGVLTVVLKLFNIVKPDYAFFGVKDYQQFVLISRMVKDLCLNIEVFGGSIIREQDGLAMSSRNVRLDKENRGHATQIHKALCEVKAAYQGGMRKESDLKRLFEKVLSKRGSFEMDYFDIREASSLEEYEEGCDPVALCAARLGGVRLIDNMVLH